MCILKSRNTLILTKETTRFYSVKTEQLQKLFAQPAVTHLSDTQLLFNTLFLNMTLISKFKNRNQRPVMLTRSSELFNVLFLKLTLVSKFRNINQKPVITL